MIYYVALPFVRLENGGLVPGEAVECPRSSAVLRRADAMYRNEENAGVVALARIDSPDSPDIGDFEDAMILKTFWRRTGGSSIRHLRPRSRRSGCFAAAVGRLSIRTGSAALRSLQAGRRVSARTIGSEIRIGNSVGRSARAPVGRLPLARRSARKPVRRLFCRPSAAAPTVYSGAKTTARN
jgi:hypothetical protein